MAAEALVIPVRVDQSSLEALDLTLRMLEDKSMDFLRYAQESGETQAIPKIQVIAMTHCGWSRTKAKTPDQSTQAFVQQVIGKISSKGHLFRDPLNKSPRPSHPRNGRMTALPFAVNSAAIDSKCRLVLHPVPWRAGSRDLFRGSLARKTRWIVLFCLMIFTLQEGYRVG